MFAIKARILTATLIITVSLTAGGCFFSGTSTLLTQVPAELQAVIDDPNAFPADPNGTLADVTAGTLIEDLGGLTGCWGTYGNVDVSAEGLEYNVFYEVYQFDADTGLANRWVLTPSWLFIPAIIMVDEGTYELIGDGRIRITLERYTFTNMTTGLSQQYTDLPDTIAVIEKLVTLSGSQLLLASPDYVDETTGEPLGRVYTRFDCPE